jgi:ABC-type Zn uptake system ZnuABC Zn-binding protein ZnuA
MTNTKTKIFSLVAAWCLTATTLPDAALMAQASREAAGHERLRVVTSLTTYEAIAKEIAGDRADVVALAEGPEDPHYVQPKPSLALTLKHADMLVTTGLDMEMWLPAVMDRANNPKVASGTPGYVAVSNGIQLCDIPEVISRAEGDSHIWGCPHIWNEPANGIIVGQNILNALKQNDPSNGTYYEEHFAGWKERVMRAHVGDELVDMLGADLLHDLDKDGRLWTFLSEQTYQGHPLTDRLGGWLLKTAPYRGKEMICYHKTWCYFARSFGITCAEYIEPKPGIPPTPRHVARVISMVRERNIPLILSASHFPHEQVELVAQRTGATAVIVPANTKAAPGIDTFIDLMDAWVNAVTNALAAREHASQP